jgi:DNA-binding NarL/FixJ family response regulator
MNKTRILVADDHEIVRQGLRAILNQRDDLEVCGEASNGREAVARAVELRPQVVVLDFGMPELNGLEATRQIRQQLPDTEVLLLTMHDTEQLVREVLGAGAKGFVLKNDAGRSLISAIEALRQHKPFFSSQVADVVLDGFLNPQAAAANLAAGKARLTPREREIVQLIAEGKSTKELADQLGIRVKTAETHRANIMRKLGLSSVADVVRYAIRNQIAQP